MELDAAYTRIRRGAALGYSKEGYPSFWHKQKANHMDSIILRVLRTWGPLTAGEVSGFTGYNIDQVEARLDDLFERSLVRCSNGRWYPTTGT
jgi:hypothetical protein